jgi:Ser/Thr protein kinase RdoA (MazF antagonist)
MLGDIQDRYTDSILAEAIWRFGFAPESMHELEGSAFVYEGLLECLPRILKIVPGVWNTDEQITGSTREQLLAEVDFVRYLAENDLPVALPVPSRNGEWVEVLPLDEKACFLVYAFEKAPGIIYPDEDEVIFPLALLVEWGRMGGRLHRLSGRYQPNGAQHRLPWHANDLLDFAALIPPEQTRVFKRRDEILQRLHALPQDRDSFGLNHGDFHHGNFLVDGEKITLFDFDAANYFWYAGEVCVALYNCLPLPRSEAVKRRAYALNYLHHFLHGYRQERAFDDFWLTQLPLFLKYCELLNYAYFHKYWDLSNLTDRRQGVLADLRQRIELDIPVVAFEPGDLCLLTN